MRRVRLLHLCGESIVGLRTNKSFFTLKWTSAPQGGMKAVVWTDVVQTVSMMGCIVLVAVRGTYNIGGLGVVLQRGLESGRIEAPV